MKRKIKFRGKMPCPNGWWIKGYLMSRNKIINREWPKGHLVDEDTIGQYTGFNDKNDKEIYDGDILRRHFVCEALGIDEDIMIYVHWGERGFVFRDITNGRNIDFCLFDCQYTEVIGNIHDNPELLKEANV